MLPALAVASKAFKAASSVSPDIGVIYRYPYFSGCKFHIDDTFHEQTARMPSRIELLSAANVRHKRSRAARRQKLAKVTT